MKLFAWLHRNAIVSGTVIDKHHYPAAGLRNQVSIASEGKYSGDFAEAPGSSLLAVEDTEGYSLVVRGVTAKGKTVTKEIYVDGGAWGGVNVGDSWPGGKSNA